MAQCTCSAWIADRSVASCPQCGRSVREEWFDEKNDSIMRLRTDVVAERPRLSKAPRTHTLIPDSFERGPKRRRPPRQRTVIGPLRGEIRLIEQTTSVKPVSRVEVCYGDKQLSVQMPSRPKQMSRSAFGKSAGRIEGMAENAARCIRRLVENDYNRECKSMPFRSVGPVTLHVRFGQNRDSYSLQLRRTNLGASSVWLVEYKKESLGKTPLDRPWKVCQTCESSMIDWPHDAVVGAIRSIVRDTHEKVECSWQFRLYPVTGQSWKLPPLSDRSVIDGNYADSYARALAALKKYARELIWSGWELENERGLYWYSLKFKRT